MIKIRDERGINLHTSKLNLLANFQCLIEKYLRSCCLQSMKMKNDNNMIFVGVSG